METFPVRLAPSVESLDRRGPVPFPQTIHNNVRDGLRTSCPDPRSEDQRPLTTETNRDAANGKLIRRRVR